MSAEPGPGFTLWLAGQTSQGQEELAAMLKAELDARGVFALNLDSARLGSALWPELGPERETAPALRLLALCRDLCEQDAVCLALSPAAPLEIEDTLAGRCLVVHLDGKGENRPQEGRLLLDSASLSQEACLAKIVIALEERGLLNAPSCDEKDQELVTAHLEDLGYL